MLKIVGQDTDQPYAESDRRVPALVDDALQVPGGQGAQGFQALGVHGVVVAGQQSGESTRTSATCAEV